MVDTNISQDEEYYTEAPEIAIPGMLSDDYNSGSSLYEGSVVEDNSQYVSTNDGGTISPNLINDQNTVDSVVGLPGHPGIDEDTG